MKTQARSLAFIAVLVALAALVACGGGGGGSTTPPPPPPPAALSVATTQLPNGVIGTAYSTTLQATGGSGTRTWTMGFAPAWLKLNASTGELTGTPTEGYYGWVDLSVKDSGGRSATTSLLLGIFAPLQIMAPPGGTLGLDYQGEIWTNGGWTPFKKLVLTGSLPPGLTVQLDETGRGTITGTPTQAGSYTFTAETSDSANPPQTVKSDITIVIDTHLAIATKQLKYALQGRPYSDTPTAINGTPPFTWSAQWLPGGLSINPSTGEITGTPTGESSTPNLTVTDSSNPVQTATRSVSVPMYYTLRSNAIDPVFATRAGYFALNASVWGGVPPLSYTLDAGQLPPGASIDPLYGMVHGTAAQGLYEFSVTAQDSASPPQLLKKSFALRVLPPPVTAVWTSETKIRVGVAFTQQLNASAGTPPYKWRLVGAVPAGLTLDESGLLSGTPTEEGLFSYVAEVSDSAEPVQTDREQGLLNVLPAVPVPNNSIANATPLGPEGGASVSISPYTDDNGVAAPDTDYFKFPAQGGSVATIATDVGYPSYADPVLELLDQNGARLKTCNNPGDDDTPTWVVRDTTPDGYDDDCVNDDGYTGLGSRLSIKVPGNNDTIQTIFAHVVDYRGDARPDLAYSISSWGMFQRLRISATAMPVAAVGKFYSWFLGYTGGLGVKTLSSQSALPPGLSLSNSYVTGFPTAAGQYAVTLRWTDSANPPEVAERTFQFSVFPKLTLDTTALPDATLGVPYDYAVTTTGGGTKLRYTLRFTPAPCCIYMREDGHIVGTPRDSGAYQVSINVEDEAGQWASKYLTLNINDGGQANTSAASRSSTSKGIADTSTPTQH